MYIIKRNEESRMKKLKISENRRYFVTEDGIPFSWLADTNWTMPQRMKWDDAEYLMQKRKSQGFTVLQIVALDPEADSEMRSPIGEKALHDNNLLTPNEKYFEYLDWILDKAESYGFYVLLLPVWGQLVVGHNWMGQTFEKTVTENNAFQFGKWIGERYKNRSHIIWCLGGDRQPVHLGTDYKNVWRLMAEGIAKGVLGKDLKYNQPDPAWEDLLMTYHTCHEMETGKCSTMSYWTDEDVWIRFIMLQSGHGLTVKNYELVAKEYNREHIMPVWDGEPAYEMMPSSWPVANDFHGPWMVRKRAFWSLFAGAFGYTYGHSSVWCSVSEKERNEMNQFTWFEALDSEGSSHMKHLREFMDATQIMTYIPSQELLTDTASAGENPDMHLQACISPKKDTICVYLPGGGGISINVIPLNSAAVWIWWYRPSDGRFYTDKQTVTDTAVKQFPKAGTLYAEAPTSGLEQDWVLIIKTYPADAPVQQNTYYDLKRTHQIKKVFEWDE